MSENNSLTLYMLRIYCIIILFTICVKASAQTEQIDVSSLPKASYTQNFMLLDRYGEVVGNIITVDFRYKEDSTVTFTNSLIETKLEEDTATYILFPPGGSETDIFIYKINGMSQHGFDTDHVELKEKIFMWSVQPKERAIRIDDLGPGYYSVSYVSCNYFGSYVLHLK